MIVRLLPLHPPAIEADIAAKLETMRRSYEATLKRDERTYHLLGALSMCSTIRPLPHWVFKALKAELAVRLPQEPDLHGVRWLMVLEGKRQGKTWQNAYKYASERLAGTQWSGASLTMKASYQDFERKRRRQTGRGIF